MNKSLLEAAAASLDNICEDESFQRLPGHVVKNELYMLKKKFDMMYDALKSGADYDDKRFTSIIKSLQDIRKEAKSFKAGDAVPISYK
jgi:hypothetical protein